MSLSIGQRRFRLSVENTARTATDTAAIQRAAVCSRRRDQQMGPGLLAVRFRGHPSVMTRVGPLEPSSLEANPAVSSNPAVPPEVVIR